MNLGFDSLKDILEVVIIPVTIFLLPRWFAAARTRKFLALIEREIEEMAPRPENPTNDKSWHVHLNKKFIHEEIFKESKISDNRDFILSLPADIAYTTSQLWRHYEKATKTTKEPELAEHGASWCDYLGALCYHFDERNLIQLKLRKGKLLLDVYQPWVELMWKYFPHLKESERLKMRKPFSSDE